MIEPMADAEWQEFGRMPLHGAPPWETLRRIFGMVDRLVGERDQNRVSNESRQRSIEILGKAIGEIIPSFRASGNGEEHSAKVAEALREEMVRLRDVENRAWYVYKDGIDEAAFRDEWPANVTEYVHGQLIFILACDPDVEIPVGYMNIEALRREVAAVRADVENWMALHEKAQNRSDKRHVLLQAERLRADRAEAEVGQVESLRDEERERANKAEADLVEAGDEVAKANAISERCREFIEGFANCECDNDACGCSEPGDPTECGCRCDICDARSIIAEAREGADGG